MRLSGLLIPFNMSGYGDNGRRPYDDGNGYADRGYPDQGYDDQGHYPPAGAEHHAEQHGEQHYQDGYDYDEYGRDGYYGHQDNHASYDHGGSYYDESSATPAPLLLQLMIEDGEIGKKEITANLQM